MRPAASEGARPRARPAHCGGLAYGSPPSGAGRWWARLPRQTAPRGWGQIRPSRRGQCKPSRPRAGLEPEQIFTDSLGEDLDPEGFWLDVEQNLRSGRVRLVFVADEIPRELRRIIEFLNERMSPTEALGIEIKQYVGQGQVRTLVPRLVGQTEQASVEKRRRGPSPEVGWEDDDARLAPERVSLARLLVERVEEAVADHGLAWTLRLRRAYLGFMRAGGHHCVGLGLHRDRPVDVWVKLPRPPDELRALGHHIEDPAPHLVSRWDAPDKLSTWQVPGPDRLPDIARAVALAARYQPASGPMPVPS